MATQFTARWTNRSDQPGVTVMTLRLTDESGVMPERVVFKCFRAEPELIDEAFLQAEAEAEITKAVEEWNALQTETGIEPV